MQRARLLLLCMSRAALSKGEDNQERECEHPHAGCCCKLGAAQAGCATPMCACHLRHNVAMALMLPSVAGTTHCTESHRGQKWGGCHDRARPKC